MTRLLLDFPWALDEDVNGDSKGFGVFRRFVNLMTEVGLEPVPFIEQEGYAEIMERLRHNNSTAHIYRYGRHLIRMARGSASIATPVTDDVGAQAPFSDTWKRALRDEMGSCQNWRTPQIVFPNSRIDVWPNTPEVSVRCSDHQEPEIRVLVPLERYSTHRFAITDLDPWRASEWIRRPPPGNRVNHPCQLPRPPNLVGVPLEQLAEHLEAIRQAGWEIHGRFYYIPPPQWHPLEVDRASWREGRAFPWRDTPRGSGAVDYLDAVWVWHRASAGLVGERHWDVQIGDDHRRISHNGRDLDRP